MGIKSKNRCLFERNRNFIVFKLLAWQSLDRAAFRKTLKLRARCGIDAHHYRRGQCSKKLFNENGKQNMKYKPKFDSTESKIENKNVNCRVVFKIRTNPIANHLTHFY